MVINIARNILGLPIYKLESDLWGYYEPAEKAWHNGELELLMRRPNTIKLIETLADLLQNNFLTIAEVNKILKEDGSSVHFRVESGDENIEVRIKSIGEIKEEEYSSEHPNIRKLVDRMDDRLKNEDFSGVLHTSASIFEILAKDIVNLESTEDQSLGSFFARYRKDSKLPAPILDFILEIFKRRGTEPLAGHGSRAEPTITKEQATIISEMTKAFLRIERLLAGPQLPAIKAQT